MLKSIVSEDKYKLLKPILSRFSEIYIPLICVNNIYTNLFSYNNFIAYSTIHVIHSYTFHFLKCYFHFQYVEG